MHDDAIETRVREELDEVLDPCSTFTDDPVSIVDLGLVEEVSVDKGVVNVHLLPTNQLCMYMMNMSDEIQSRVTKIPSVEQVEVEQVNDKIWTQDRMADEEYNKRQERFQQRVEEHDLTPYYENEGQTSS